MSKSTTGLRASKEKPFTKLKIEKEEAMHQWRTLVKKRNSLWNKGQDLSNEEDLELRQLVALLNLYNK